MRLSPVSTPRKRSDGVFFPPTLLLACSPAVNWATSRFRALSVRRRYQHKVATPDATEDRYTHPELAEHLAALPMEQRTVLVLRYLLDWDIAMTAEALGIAPGTVRSRTARASAALRARIDLREQP